MSVNVREVTEAADKVSRLSPQGVNNIIIILMTLSVVAFAAWQSFVHVPNLISSHHDAIKSIVAEHKDAMNGVVNHLQKINETQNRLDTDVQEVKRDVRDIKEIVRER